MAFFEMNYHSDALGMGVSVNVIIPEKAKTMIGMDASGGDKYKTLYLLHGLSDDHTIWMRRTSIERYASEYGIAVVMPNVGRSWYTDTAYGVKYFTFVAEELPRVCRGFFRGMSENREDNFVAGLSMGGYGALKIGLTLPDKFCGCASLSGAIDLTVRERPYIKNDVKWIFGADVESATELKGTKDDIYYLTECNKREGKVFPKIYLWCGTEDSLIDSSREYHSMLESMQISHIYKESEGNHSWKWWDLHIQDVLKFFFGKE